MRFGLILALMLLAGCTVERNGVVKHVVVGFGVVTVPKTNAVATISSVQAVGVYYSTGIGSRFSLGYVNGTIAQIEDSATNVVIETK